MATVGEDRGARLFEIIDEHSKESWRERAKVDVSRYMSAAFKGMGPFRVACQCNRCDNNTGSHHIFCTNSGKPREENKRISNKLKLFLRTWASEVATDQMVRGASY